MNITPVFAAHNRSAYTRKYLARLLSDLSSDFDLYVWDNASTDQTPDGKDFRSEWLAVALGVGKAGQKHVLGLWHGATENRTVACERLADLREPGLEPEAALLVVLDGCKALHKGVTDVFGERALVQP